MNSYESKHIMKQFFTLLLASTIAMLAACTQPTGKSNIENLQDSSVNSNSDSIKNDLTRSKLILFEGTVKAYPMTGALIKTAVKEEGRKLGLSPQEIQDSIQRVSELQKNRSCFYASFNSVNSDFVNLGYWGIDINQNGKSIPLRFIDISSRGTAVTTRQYYTTTNSYSNTVSINSSTTTEYYNSGTVCTEPGNKIEYLNEFNLNFIGRFMKKPKTATLTWSDPRK